MEGYSGYYVVPGVGGLSCDLSGREPKIMAYLADKRLAAEQTVDSHITFKLEFADFKCLQQQMEALWDNFVICSSSDELIKLKIMSAEEPLYCGTEIRLYDDKARKMPGKNYYSFVLTDSFENNHYLQIVSLSHGNEGRVFRIIEKVKNREYVSVGALLGVTGMEEAFVVKK